MTLTYHAAWLLQRLHQNQTWQDVDAGHTIPLADLTASRRRGALRWLRAHAELLWECQRIDLALRNHTVDGERELHAHKVLPPAVWLEDTPLVRALATQDARSRWFGGRLPRWGR